MVGLLSFLFMSWILKKGYKNAQKSENIQNIKRSQQNKNISFTSENTETLSQNYFV